MFKQINATTQRPERYMPGSGSGSPVCKNLPEPVYPSIPVCTEPVWKFNCYKPHQVKKGGVEANGEERGCRRPVLWIIWITR
jgi:hypothetical protein